MHEVIRQHFITLPWPPSTNSLWRHVGKRTLISKKYREYKSLVLYHSLFWKINTIKGRISIEIKAFPPDNRKRDLDNLLKGTADSLQNSGLFLDDSQIDFLSIERMESKKPGMLEILIKEISIDK